MVRGGDFVAFYDNAEARLLGDIHARGPRSGMNVPYALRIFSLHTAFDVALAIFLAVRLLRKPASAPALAAKA